MNKQTFLIVSILWLCLCVVPPLFSGNFKTKTVMNPHTGKLDYTLDGSQIYTAISSANGGSFQNLSAYLRHSAFANNSAYTASHIRSVTPYGSHPAAGSNYQTQYNNQGSPAGASYARYSSGVSIKQASSRYAHSQEWKGPDDDLQAYILGSGIMVLGVPYTDDFALSGWAHDISSTLSTFLNIPAFTAKSNHSFDVFTLVKGTTVIFRGFTSLDYAGSGCAYVARRNPPNRTQFRMVLTTGVKDIDGNALLQSYSSPFIKYSTAGA